MLELFNVSDDVISRIFCFKTIHVAKQIKFKKTIKDKFKNRSGIFRSAKVQSNFFKLLRSSFLSLIKSESVTNIIRFFHFRDFVSLPEAT